MSGNTVTSADGTIIAYEKFGSGPSVVLVDGALCYGDQGPMRPLAQALAAKYTVYRYDRRGRGDSGDTQPYDTRREVEDLEAVAALADEPVHVYAISSGVPLALAALEHGLAVKKVALYEFPLIVDDSREPVAADYRQSITGYIEAGRPGSAVRHFMRWGVGLPAVFVALFPVFPGWKKLKGVGHTLAYDLEFMGDALDGNPIPADRYDAVKASVTVLAGGKSPAWLRGGNAALARAIPNAQHRVIDGQNHMIKAPALSPVLTEIFTED